MKRNLHARSGKTRHIFPEEKLGMLIIHTNHPVENFIHALGRKRSAKTLQSASRSTKEAKNTIVERTYRFSRE